MKCLASDLHAFIIVDEFGFTVKEKTSGRMIARGLNKNEMYYLSGRHFRGAALTGVRTNVAG